eukprot:SAG25_NODE_355_length_9210_cov_4.731424_1_plen_26_part_10
MHLCAVLEQKYVAEPERLRGTEGGMG